MGSCSERENEGLRTERTQRHQKKGTAQNARPEPRPSSRARPCQPTSRRCQKRRLKAASRQMPETRACAPFVIFQPEQLDLEKTAVSV